MAGLNIVMPSEIMFILCILVAEERLWKANLISLPGKVSSKKQNVYFQGSTARGGHIEDDHVPFLKQGK